MGIYKGTSPVCNEATLGLNIYGHYRKTVLIFFGIKRMSTKENFVKVKNNSIIVINFMYMCAQNQGLCLHQMLEVNTKRKHNNLIQLVL